MSSNKARSNRQDREGELNPQSQNFLSEISATLKKHKNQHLEASRRGVTSTIILSGLGVLRQPRESLKEIVIKNVLDLTVVII